MLVKHKYREQCIAYLLFIYKTLFYFSMLISIILLILFCLYALGGHWCYSGIAKWAVTVLSLRTWRPLVLFWYSKVSNDESVWEAKLMAYPGLGHIGCEFNWSRAWGWLSPFLDLNHLTSPRVMPNDLSMSSTIILS